MLQTNTFLEFLKKAKLVIQYTTICSIIVSVITLFYEITLKVMMFIE